jgi:serpin B
MIKKTFLFLAISAVAFACNKGESDAPTQQCKELSAKENSYVRVSNSFAFDMFKTFSDEMAKSNVFISPLSMQLALSMAYNGAGSDTREAFEKTLRMSGLSTFEINSFFQKMVKLLSASDNLVHLSFANSIWYRQDFQVLDTFLSVNQAYYDAEVKKADFSDPLTVHVINDWISDKTNGKITNVIDKISESTVMYLINAIYFNGTWKYAFDKSKTTEVPFYQEDSTTSNCQLMQQQSKFNYVENDLLQMVELPYGNGNFAMYVLVPQAGKKITDIVAALSDDNWAEWNAQMAEQDVVVKIPRFKFNWGRSILPELKQMGLGIAFDASLADFTGIQPNSNLFISNVIHKSFVDVNESGTEAAAVTVIEIDYTSVGPGEKPVPKYFVADKPFLFLIKEKTTGSLLFMGAVKNPVNE